MTRNGPDRKIQNGSFTRVTKKYVTRQCLAPYLLLFLPSGVVGVAAPRRRVPLHAALSPVQEVRGGDEVLDHVREAQVALVKGLWELGGGVINHMQLLVLAAIWLKKFTSKTKSEHRQKMMINSRSQYLM